MNVKIVFRCVLRTVLWLWTLTLAGAFYPNQYSDYVGQDDYTHAEITETGILKAVAAYLEETPVKPGGSPTGAGTLTGIANITAKKLYDQVYRGSRSPMRLQEAIDEVIYYNNKVDQDHFDKAAWHFNGEQITQSNIKLQDLRKSILDELRKQDPDYNLARVIIGQFLHILQMFYSNSNWVDDNKKNMYPAIGMTGVTMLPIAPPTLDTCSSCTLPCIMNIEMTIRNKYLTSGYKSGQDIVKPYKDPSTTTKGKCSHGGPTDNTTLSVAATGGINKDSKNYANSPHYYYHVTAAEVAIEHTTYVFNDNTNGIRHLIPPDNFKKLFNLDSIHSLVFVIDKSASIATDLPIIKQQVQEIIIAASTSNNPPAKYVLVTFSDPVSAINLQETVSASSIKSWIAGIQASGGNDCPEFTLTALEQAANISTPYSTIFVFTDASPKDPYKEERVASMIANKRLLIKFVVTGTCSTTDNSGLKYSNNLKNIVGRKRRTVSDEDYNNSNKDQKQNEKSPEEKRVLIMKHELSIDEPPIIQIPFDITLTEVVIEIQGDSGMPYPILQKPDQEYINIDGESVSEIRYYDNTVTLTMVNPQPGIWNLFRLDKNYWSVEVTGSSSLDFEYKISKIVNTSTITDFYRADVFIDQRSVMLYNILVGNQQGDILQKVGLLKKSHSSRKEYSCVLESIRNDAVYGIEGYDLQGNMFQRFHYSALSLKLNAVHHKEHSRRRRSTTWDLFDVYRKLASFSGGQLYQTTKDQIPNAALIFKASLAKSEVVILNNIFPGGPSTAKTIEIPVDNSITQFTLNIHSNVDVPRFLLKDFRGNIKQIDNNTVTLYNIGETFLSIVVEQPGAGVWTLQKLDINEWDVKVTAHSTVDFSSKFMQYDVNTHSFHEFIGRPIPDENVTLAIELNDKNVLGDLSHVSLLDATGNEIHHYSLKPIKSRRSGAFFSTTIIIPHQNFKLAVIGITSQGDPFVRMHTDVKEIVNIKLQHTPEKVPFYINENINVSFVIGNAGSQDEDVKVTIKDDKNFISGSNAQIFHLKAWTNQTGYFTLHGGPTKGEITSITITAMPVVATRSNSKYQLVLTHLTVEERPLDTVPPVCNVTSPPVVCNDPCTCSQVNNFITVEMWDEGDGLQNIIAQAPNSSVNAFHIFGFYRGLVKEKGIVQALLVVDCCRKNVTIEVMDLKNLTGSCDILIDPSYDVNACTTTTSTTSQTTTANNPSTTTDASSTLTTPSTSSLPTTSLMPTSQTSSTGSMTKSTTFGLTTIKASAAAVTTNNANPSTTVPVSTMQVSGSRTLGSSSISPTIKEKNSNEITDGAAYGIAAVVGGTTMAIVTAAVIYVIRRILNAPLKTEPERFQ